MSIESSNIGGPKFQLAKYERARLSVVLVEEMLAAVLARAERLGCSVQFGHRMSRSGAGREFVTMEKLIVRHPEQK